MSRSRFVVLAGVVSCARPPEPVELGNVAPTFALDSCVEPGRRYNVAGTLWDHVASYDPAFVAELAELAELLDLQPLRDAVDRSPEMGAELVNRVRTAPLAHLMWVAGWANEPSGDVTMTFGFLVKERVASREPPGWEIELPCSLTIESRDDELPRAKLRFRARLDGGPWQPRSGTATWSAADHRVELIAGDETWRW